MSTKSLLIHGVSLMACAVASPAWAQNADAAEGEIVVTAQRREESLQKVPIAVSAFSSESLKAQKIEGGADIQTGVPNVNFAQGQRGNNVTIRGIGTKAFSGASDSATGIHFNGAPMSDTRLLTGKGTCVADPGPSSVGGQAVTDPLVRALLSQGCANARLDPKAGNALPNSLTSFIGLAAYRTGLASGNVYAGQNFSADLDTVSASQPVVYQAREDIWEGGLTLDLSDGLQLNYLGSYQKDRVNSSQEGLLEQPGAAFLSTSFAPGGFVNDPQLGASNRLTYVNANFRTSEQHFQELRLSSSFAGPFNFSLGGNYLDYSLRQVAGVYSHALTAFAMVANGGAPCAVTATNCVYIDPSSELQGIGHNYFLGIAPYKLKSYAAFGEAYYELNPSLKLTAGGRFTRDEKQLENVPARLLSPGSGYPQGTPPFLKADFQAVTGRLGLDWRPQLGFTDATMFYAFASRGYKGGGLNPVAAGVPTTFRPEYVNSLEIGTKNTLMGGALTLNASAFYYDYKDYQISKFVNRQTITENVDARIYGFEFESVLRPASGLRLGGIELIAEYRDRYRRFEDGWKIVERELTRLIDLEAVPIEDRPASAN